MVAAAARRSAFLALAAILALPWTAASAQQPPDAPAALLVDQSASAEPPAVAAPAALVLANRKVFTFRVPFLRVSPEGRAAAAMARIQTRIRHGRVGPVESSVVPEGIVILVDGEGVFNITPGDVNAEAGETLDALREHTVTNLRLALGEEVELRNLPDLLWALGRVLLATLAFVLAVRIVRRGLNWLAARVEAIASKRLGTVSVGGYTFLTAEQVARTERRFVGALRWLAVLGVTYAWLTYVLQQFPYTRPWGEDLGAYTLRLAWPVLQTVLDGIPGLLVVVLILLGTRALTRLVIAFFAAVERGEVALKAFHPDTAQATRRILNVVLWLLAAVLAYPYVPGSDTAAFKGIGLIAGLMLSLGSTNLVGQLMSGFSIVYARQFRAGDYVRIGETEGTVLSLGLFATKIRTNRLEEVSIPNSVVVSTQTKNYSRAPDDAGVILHATVCIGYDVPWRQVHALLVEAAGRTPGLKREPPPFVYQSALSDFAVEYQVHACLERPEQRVRTLAALHASIQDAFNEQGVQIMTPHYEGDPEAPKIVPKDRWGEPPAGSAPAERAPS